MNRTAAARRGRLLGLGLLAAVGLAASPASEAALRLAFRTRRRIPVSPGQAPVWIEAARGKRLAARYLPPAQPDGTVVLVIHGWGASSADMAVVGQHLTGDGFGVLLVDARCHGDSDDDDFASMPRFAEDVETGLRWLADTHGVPSERVVLLGHSVGAGATLLVASRTPVAGVVAIACMAHPREMMTAMMARKRLPATLARVVLWKVQRVLGQSFDSFAPVNTIAAAACPILLLHGDADTTVPVADATRLQQAAPRRAQLLIAPGADHRSVEAFLEMADEVTAFISACTAEGAADALKA